MSRRILPNLQAASSSSPAPNPGPLPPGPVKPTYARRGKITIVACVPCRKRKTKCDGKRPACGQCTARDGTCAYDMTDEQRKLTYLRDHSEQLQRKLNALEALLHALQNGPDEEAHELFRRLKDGESPYLLADYAQSGGLQSDASQQGPPSTSSFTRYADGQSPEVSVSRIQQYERLMELLGTVDSITCDDILRRLRAGQDVATILYALDKGKAPLGATSGALLEQNESMGQVPSLEMNWQQYRGFGLLKDPNATMDGIENDPQAVEVVDEVFQTEPWTTVTQDRELVEHLLRLYFTWQHAFFQNFPEDLFRRDMASGRTKYCSSSLVNALCAAGCYLSYRERVQWDRQEHQSLSSAFFDEAIAQLNKQPKPDLPTTAAMYLISYVEGYRGDTSGQWMLGGRSVLMALDLHLHMEPENLYGALRHPVNDQERDDELMARSHAFWGCFHVMQLNSFTLGRLPLFSEHAVAVDLPEADPAHDAQPWEAYEMSLAEKPGARSTTFRECAGLSLIINSTLFMFYAPTEALTGARLVSEYEKYTTWYQNLPANVASTRNAPPHVLCLHLYYKTAILLLFRPFLKATITDSDLVPRDICRDAADSISSIWALHREMFGLSGVWQFQVNCLLIASTIHIINIPAISATQNLMQACSTFQDLVGWHGWARSSLNTLRDLVVKWSIVLPKECEEVLYRDIRSQTASPGIGGSQMTLSSHGNRTARPEKAAVWPEVSLQNNIEPRAPLLVHSQGLRTAPSAHQQGVVQNWDFRHPSPRQAYETPPASYGMSPVPKRDSFSAASVSSSRSRSQQPKRPRLIASYSQTQQAPASQYTSVIGDMATPQSSQYEQSPSSATSGRVSSGRQIQGTGWAQNAQHQHMHSSASMAPSNYLYNPSSLARPPLLVPTQMARSSQQTSAQSQVESDRAQYSTSSAQAPHYASSTQWDLHDGVEGLSFGDHWRDPYLSMSRQPENPVVNSQASQSVQRQPRQQYHSDEEGNQ